MTAYERIAARNKKLKKSRPEFSEESERESFNTRLNPLSELRNEPFFDPLIVPAPKPNAPTKSRVNILQPPQPAERRLQTPIEIPPPQPKKADIESSKIIDAPPVTAMTNNRKSVTFEDYTGLEEDPRGKRDGLQLRGENMSVRDNVRYLLGQHTVPTNDGKWRIVEIGESVEENSLTFSRALLVFWQLLPQVLYGDGKPYWILAIILAFVTRTNQNGGWLLGVFLFSVVLEVVLVLLQINGKFQFAKEADRRVCKKYDRAERQWKEVSYESLTAGDLIKLLPQDEFPCDTLLLQSTTSRLVGIREDAYRGNDSLLVLKETVLQRCLELPFSGLVYLRTDADLEHMTRWNGRVQLNTTRHNISYKNFVHRGSINHDSSQLVGVVLYTMCNQKRLESVQYPIPLKPKRLEGKLSLSLTILSAIGMLCAVLEAAINIAFSYAISSTDLLHIVTGSTISLTFLAKYICEFTIAIPIFVKLVYLSYGLINSRLVEKDPFFVGELKVGDAHSLSELYQARVMVADLKTLYHRKSPRLRSLHVKELVYAISEDTDFMLPKDVQLLTDFLQAAFLSCQEEQDSWQKSAILQSGSKFGLQRDYSTNVVRLREDAQQITAELIKEHPPTESRPFSLTFYRETRSNRILCVARGSSSYIISKMYSSQSEISKLTRRLELIELCLTELVGKCEVSSAKFQEFIEVLESGPLTKLNDVLLELLRNIEVLGVLAYENPHLEESVELHKIFQDAQIATLLTCSSGEEKDCFLRHMKLTSEDINEECVIEDAESCPKERLRNDIKILDGNTIEKIGVLGKLHYLVQIIVGNGCTVFVNYTSAQLTSLLQLLKRHDVPTCSLVEKQSNLLLMKHTDVAVSISTTEQPYLDKHRYCDIKLNSLRQFMKLLFLHSHVLVTLTQNSYMASSKLLVFLLSKSFMLFFCELTYSFYTLCTAVPLVPAVNEYLLEIWLLSLLPAVFYLFEGDHDFNTLVRNPKLFRGESFQYAFSVKNIAKALAVAAFQSVIIVMVVMYSLTEAVDGTGTIKGHEMTGFLVFFCIFHTLLFKMAISGERLSWHQAVLVVAGVLLYYATIAVFCSHDVASVFELSQRKIITSVFRGRGFLIAAVVSLEASLIDLMLLLNYRVFAKTILHVQRPSKKVKEVSQHELVVLDLPQ